MTSEYYQLVFMDGHFQVALSSLPETQSFIATNLAYAKTHHQDLLQYYMGQHPLALTDGAFIFVRSDCIVTKPIHLLFLSSKDSLDSSQTLHNVLIFEKGAQATLFEEHESLNTSPYEVNVCTELYADNQAQVIYHKLQQQHSKSYHFANFDVMQKSNSRVVAHHYHLGGEKASEDINVCLNESGACLSLRGLALAYRKRQHIDVNIFVQHLADYTQSEELFKCVVASQARGVFKGKIFVTENIKQAVANLQNKNLLLAKDAEINTKPELEIYSDDVKCNHGAAIGQLDPQMLFYLRSRGIPQETAYQLLLLAFINEQFTAMPQTVSAKILQAITDLSDTVVGCLPC
jgi:Fe-S cluster assembly protein SufD